MKYISKSLEETKQIACDFMKNVSPVSNGARVVGLYGELGAGKTSFMQGLSEAFGIKDYIVSPTFVIEKIYELERQPFRHLIHIDAYRLETSTELIHLGWSDLLSDSKNLICIEWPERVIDIMPVHIHINFKHISDHEREIEIVV